MQQNILYAIALSGCGFGMKAQRGNAKLRYLSNKTERLDSNKTVKDSRDEKVTVEVTNDAISIEPVNNPAETLTGNVTDVSCLWREAFVNGKTVIQTTLQNTQQQQKKATVTIESLDGQITILVEAAETPCIKTRLQVYRHEELLLN